MSTKIVTDDGATVVVVVEDVATVVDVVPDVLVLAACWDVVAVVPADVVGAAVL